MYRDVICVYNCQPLLDYTLLQEECTTPYRLDRQTLTVNIAERNFITFVTLELIGTKSGLDPL